MTREERQHEEWLLGTPMDDVVLSRIAHIIGENSAAALSLAERNRRREAGESVEIRNCAGVYVVGPSSQGRS